MPPGQPPPQGQAGAGAWQLVEGLLPLPQELSHPWQVCHDLLTPANASMTQLTLAQQDHRNAGQSAMPSLMLTALVALHKAEQL